MMLAAYLTIRMYQPDKPQVAKPVAATCLCILMHSITQQDDSGTFNNFLAKSGANVSLVFYDAPVGADNPAIPSPDGFSLEEIEQHTRTLLSATILHMQSIGVPDSDLKGNAEWRDMLKKAVALIIYTNDFIWNGYQVTLALACLAIGRPFNERDAGGVNRQSRSDNLFRASAMTSVDELTGSTLPVLSEQMHKGITDSTNQFPGARSIIAQKFVELCFDESDANPILSNMLQTTLKFLQEAGQNSYAMLRDGLLAVVPFILAHPDFSAYQPRVHRISEILMGTPEPMRPFVWLLGLPGHEEFSNKTYQNLTACARLFALRINGSSQTNLRTSKSTAAEALCATALSFYYQSKRIFRTIFTMAAIVSALPQNASTDGAVGDAIAAINDPDAKDETDRQINPGPALLNT